MVIWFTGLPCSGKTTMANAVNHRLAPTYRTVVLDGDEVRSGLCSDLDFSVAGRRENIRRAAEVAKLLSVNGFMVLAAFVSPRPENREMVRSIVKPELLMEVYCKCPISVCKQRDTKGFYRNPPEKFTGVTDIYIEPKLPTLILNTDTKSVEQCVELVVDSI